jgi:hypothetical protein
VLVGDPAYAERLGELGVGRVSVAG